MNLSRELKLFCSSAVLLIFLFFIAVAGGCGGKNEDSQAQQTQQQGSQSSSSTTQDSSSYRLNKEQAATYLQWLEKNDHERYQELQALKEFSYDAFQEVLIEDLKQRELMEQLKKIDPPVYHDMLKKKELNKQLRREIKNYKDLKRDKFMGNQEAIEKTEKRIANILDELFDMKMSEYRGKISLLERRVQRYKEMLERRQKNKEKVVNKKLEEIKEKVENPEFQWEMTISDTEFINLSDLGPPPGGDALPPPQQNQPGVGGPQNWNQTTPR